MTPMTPMTPTRVLLVEDSRSAAQLMMSHLAPQGYEISLAEDGQAAWEIMSAGNAPPFDTVVLDREMPRMNGIELLRKIKATPALRQIPVVMVTTLSDEKSIREGLAEGAYYYLAKPYAPKVLLSILKATLDQHREHCELRESVRLAERPFELMHSGVFQFRTLEDGKILCQAVARACPQPERTVPGLMELILNAVEHGNLAIGYAEKTRLMLNDTWLAEINRRIDTPAGQDKHVTLRFERTSEVIHITLQDQGQGFDWQNYLEFDPNRAFDNHGRGIAMARMLSLDDLEYFGNGNTVRATIFLP